MPISFLMDWTMRNSTSLASCHPLLFWYMLNLFFFFSNSFTLFVMASKGGKLQQEEPAAGEPIDSPHLPWMVYAYDLDGFAQEHVVPRNPNVMGYPFPPNTQAVSSSFPLFFFLLAFSPFFQSLTFLSSTQVVVVMIMMMMAMMRRIQRILLATNQGRGNIIDYLQSRHIGIRHTYFFLFVAFIVFYFLQQTFEFSLRQRVVLKNIFLHLSF